MQVELWPLDKIIPYARNPRVNEGAVDKVAASLREFGWKQPVVVDSQGVLVVGHTRVLAAKKLGMSEAPVVVAADLTPAQCKAYRLADNRTNEEAEWNRPLLALELEDLKFEDFDLRLTGFDADELGGLEALANAQVEGLTDPDDAPEPPAIPVSVPGDLWICGNHRVLCGDATQSGDLEKLMAGEPADLVVTDPPYNVAYDGTATKRRSRIANDSANDETFRQFLTEAARNLFACSRDGAGIYVFHPDIETLNFIGAFAEAGWLHSQHCIWIKQHFVLGRKDYHYQHEMVLYGWKPTAPHAWHADRKQTTVWNFDKPDSSAHHSTMKPVALVEYPIANSSREGDVVLDLFGGSGSVLIACEKTARRGRLMELDPKYVDVIVRRWEEFTGRKAVHEDGSRFQDRCAA